MLINTIEALEWDSQFFGYPVARIFLDHEGCEKLDNIFQQLKTGKFRVTYFFVPPDEDLIINRVTKEGSKLVDQKTIFSKTAEKHDKFSNDISEFQEEEINEKLIELVLQAGSYSRFRLDVNFKKKEFERLYIEWLSKSVKKKIAFKTLLAKKGSDIIGIATLGEKEHYAEIGLVAVCENFRGQKIGYDLIRAADTAAFEMGLNEIRVVTQQKNEGACRLYEKCHFQIEEITNIYHYWQK